MISKLLGKDEEIIARERPKVWLGETAMEMSKEVVEKSDEIKVKLSFFFLSKFVPFNL